MKSEIISMVGSARSTRCEDAKICAVLEAIREGKWRAPIDRIRHEYTSAIATGNDPKQAVSALKRELPGILWSGKFNRRSTDGLEQHSGLLCADLDAIPSDRLQHLKPRVADDPHVIACFLSPTGTGLKVVFSVEPDPALHLASFRSVQQYLLQHFNIAADESAKDVSRICFVSWDPEINGHPMPKVLPPITATEFLSPDSRPPRPSDSSPKLPASAEQLLHAGAPQGRRNERALWLACQLRDAGFDRPATETHLRAFASRCSPAFPEAEAMAAVRSAFTRPPRRPAKPTRTSGRASAAAEYLGGDDDQRESITFPEPNPWPEPMHPAARLGLVGELMDIIEPNTEADPAAILVMFLAAFGNVAGAKSHFMAEARAHGMRVWPILVGETAKGRKGSAWSTLRHVLGQVDPSWTKDRVQSGLSSGEGLIYAVRDPVTKDKKGEVVIEDHGVSDKRLFCIEEEFSAVLKVAERNGNTITDVLRRAWDDGDLRTLTKQSPTRATGAHVTVVGHITIGELNKLLSETDAINGFGNRFLWLVVRRSKLLPEGGNLHKTDLSKLVLSLRRALDFARTSTQVGRTPDADALWRDVYPILTADRPGRLGALTNRAEAYVLRLALVYAALDSSRLMEVQHLRAALAVWDYCERSAKFIFGETLGDRVQDRLRDELTWAGSNGLSLSRIRDIFNRNEPSYRLRNALQSLQRAGLARSECFPNNPGRPLTFWYAVDAKNDLNAKTSSAPTSIGSMNPLLSFLT